MGGCTPRAGGDLASLSSALILNRALEVDSGAVDGQGDSSESGEKKDIDTDTMIGNRSETAAKHDKRV